MEPLPRGHMTRNGSKPFERQTNSKSAVPTCSAKRLGLSLSLAHTLSLSHTHTHAHTLSLTHTHTPEQLEECLAYVLRQEAGC